MCTILLYACTITAYNHYVHVHNFAFKRVAIGYTLESFLPVTAPQLFEYFAVLCHAVTIK